MPRHFKMPDTIARFALVGSMLAIALLLITNIPVAPDSASRLAFPTAPMPMPMHADPRQATTTAY